MNNIALGRYIPGNSFVHQLDPRIKIISLFLLLVAIFLPAGFIGYGVLFIFFWLLIANAGITMRYLLKSMKPMLFMIVFLSIINVFMLRTGTVIVDFYGFKIYDQAILTTVYIIIRLFLMIMATTILTATTKPLDLTLGIEDLLVPLKVFHVPAHEIAMMISIALRFIPTLIDEANRIMKAQASRGVDFNQGKLKEKVTGVLSLIIPLFVSSFQRAEELADAMEARGYSPGKTRTRYKQLHVRTTDWLALIITVMFVAGMAVYAYAL